ncbi:DUF2237 family protein [Oceanibium sediminis]|uniref:DUF2237 family protein n=1 Tax=Oceanibium sediminis TaxID=2026339 RepID=UPI000DD42462|nr:DUF2237 domain-containing protein [Oceanibium sediminis]
MNGKLDPVNVLGGPLGLCSVAPITGFWRDGCCNTGPADHGRHTVCAVMTAEFLAFSAARGNDLSTPRPEFGFEGLKPGDRWCLCAERWVEAFDAGAAPDVVLEATHHATLGVTRLQDLQAHAARR